MIKTVCKVCGTVIGYRPVEIKKKGVGRGSRTFQSMDEESRDEVHGDLGLDEDV